MKKKQFYNLFLIVTVWFSILFQSFHGYAHLLEQISEKHCEHKAYSKFQITHQHHKLDNCFVCKFSLSFGFANEPIHFATKITHNFSVAFFYYKKQHSFFSGSHFGLRGPPYIV